MVVPKGPETTKAERNHHTRYIRNHWVRRRGHGDMRLCDYLDLGFGTPERPIVVEPVYEDYVEPLRFPMEAIRLLACEYARVSGLPGYAGKSSESDSDGNVWTVSTIDDACDADGNIVVPRQVRLSVERGYYKRLDLENQLRRATLDLADAGKRLRGLSLVEPRGDDRVAIEHKAAQVAKWTEARDAAEAEVTRLKAEVARYGYESWLFPLNPKQAEWMVRS